MSILLLSNSRQQEGFLQHAMDAIEKAVDGRKQAVFIPYAAVISDWDVYFQSVVKALFKIGLALTPLHRCEHPLQTLKSAQLIIVGGGNTFRLLKLCRQYNLLNAIVECVSNGVPYIGWSAGANLACPTICTTNDMPIVDPGGFDALNLVPFQINPHFTNSLPVGHYGETRQQRIEEFLTLHPRQSVIGLVEGSWIYAPHKDATEFNLQGPYPAVLFNANQPPESLMPGPFHFYSQDV